MDRDRALSIGLTGTGRSVADRVWDHYRRPDRGDPAVHAAIRNLQPGQVLVQIAHPSGPIGRARARLTRLRRRERPLVDPDPSMLDGATPWS